MSQTDWAKKYAAMDERLLLKYEQLPSGEQIGKRPQTENAGKKRPEADLPQVKLCDRRVSCREDFR